MRHFDKIAHIVLYTCLAIGAIAVYLSRYSAQRQFTVILLIVVFYLIWGFSFHHMRGDATRKLMLEYLVIASISLLAAILVLWI